MTSFFQMFYPESRWWMVSVKTSDTNHLIALDGTCTPLLEACSIEIGNLPFSSLPKTWRMEKLQQKPAMHLVFFRSYIVFFGIQERSSSRRGLFLGADRWPNKTLVFSNISWMKTYTIHTQETRISKQLEAINEYFFCFLFRDAWGCW